LLFPVIVEIRQQRGARSAHGGVDIAVDPRGRHAGFLGRHSWRRNMPPVECAAERTQAQGLAGQPSYAGFANSAAAPLAFSQLKAGGTGRRMKPIALSKAAVPTHRSAAAAAPAAR